MESRHSDIVIRITLILLAVAMLLYVGLFAYETFSGEEHRAVAVSYTHRDTVDLTGLIVRQETVLSSRSLYTHVTAAHAQRAASGDTLGLSYASAADRARALRMESLESEIALAEKVLSGISEENTAAERAEAARSAVLSLCRDTGRHSLRSLRGDALRLRSLVFEEGDSITREELSALNRELRELRSEGEIGATELISPVSGVFTPLLDGGESLDPAVLTGLSVGSLRSLLRRSASVDERCYGKLVTEQVWYLAALLPEENARSLEPGDELRLDLSHYRIGLCPITVVSVSPALEGECAVLFSSSEALSETLALRKIDCPLVMGSVTGLRLPREALQQGAGEQYYVTLETGSAERRCSVELLYDGGDFVMVSGEELREGSPVIWD